METKTLKDQIATIKGNMRSLAALHVELKQHIPILMKELGKVLQVEVSFGKPRGYTSFRWRREKGNWGIYVKETPLLDMEPSYWVEAVEALQLLVNNVDWQIRRDFEKTEKAVATTVEFIEEVRKHVEPTKGT